MRNLNGVLAFSIITIFVFGLSACRAAFDPEQATSKPPIIVESPTIEPTSSPDPTPSPKPTRSFSFDGESAFKVLTAQVELGPRVPGSDAHAAVQELIILGLQQKSWTVETQDFSVAGLAGRNLIGRANLGKGPVVILGAHYDTRAISDRSPEISGPVPGANDGASGVAVLLELARSLDLEQIDHEIWLAFFDLEDQGNGAMPGLDYIEGSSYMANMLPISPEAVIIVDMVGDQDQQLPFETYSDQELKENLWAAAKDLGFGAVFVPVDHRAIRDDHLPFIQKGIPAIDIIDFDYPYWHTAEDTVDKTSSESLFRVGRTIEYWLEEKKGG